MTPPRPPFGLPSRAGIAGALPVPTVGLRERKKAQTRLHISDVATTMFLEHGFDRVTVAQVAEESGVSVKTVFNYFGAKEDLVFDREPEWLASIDALAERRRPGHGLLRVMLDDVAVRWPALEFGRWSDLTEEAVAGRGHFYRFVTGHPALRARGRLMAERIGVRIRAAAAADYPDPESIEARTAGALLHAAYDAPGRELVTQLMAGTAAAVVVDRARSTGLHALGTLERAYVGTPLVEGPPA